MVSANRNKATKPVADKPKAAKPVAAKSKATKPVAVKLKAAKPVAVKPNPAKRKVSTSEMSILEQTKPKLYTIAVLNHEKLKMNTSLPKYWKGYKGMGPSWGNMIYQFKVRLDDTHPPVWRRILIPESFTFRELHFAIQASMGWRHCHLHEFRKRLKSFGQEIRIGNALKDYADDDTIAEERVSLSSYFSLEYPKAKYTYDFGDNWEHTIVLEKILPADANVVYPQCITGKRACPPEDCGSIEGYEDIIEIMADQKHEERAALIEWLGGEFDAEAFNPQNVVFWNPYN